MAKLDLQADSVEQLTKGINPPKKVKVEAVVMDAAEMTGEKSSEGNGAVTTETPAKRRPGRPKKRKIDLIYRETKERKKKEKKERKKGEKGPKLKEKNNYG